MANPFFYYSDPWSAAPRRRPVESDLESPLFYTADPWIGARRRPTESDMESPYCYSSSPWTAAPRRRHQPQRPTPAPASVHAQIERPRGVTIPVHFVRSDGENTVMKPARTQPTEEVRSAAATTIQRVFRGHQVRKNLKVVSKVAAEVSEIEQKIDADQERLREDPKERLRMNEMLMALLLRLDSIRGVREYRKKVIRRVIALQEFLDTISAQPPQSSGCKGSGATISAGMRPESRSSDASPEETILKNSVGETAPDVSDEQSRPEQCRDQELVAAHSLMDSEATILAEMQSKNPNSDASMEEAIAKKIADETATDVNDNQFGAEEGQTLDPIAAQVASQDEGKDPTLITVVDAEAPGIRRGTDESDMGSEAVDYKNECEKDGSEDQKMVNGGFEVVSDEGAHCCSSTETELEKDPSHDAMDQDASEAAAIPTEEVTETSNIAAGEEVGSQMAEETSVVEPGKEPVKVSEMAEVLRKVMAESERLQGLVAALCERNAQQCRLMEGLVDRVEHLERAVHRMEKKNKKRRANCSLASPLDKKSGPTKQ